MTKYGLQHKQGMKFDHPLLFLFFFVGANAPIHCLPCSAEPCSNNLLSTKPSSHHSNIPAAKGGRHMVTFA